MTRQEEIELIQSKQDIEEHNFKLYAEANGITQYYFSPLSYSFDVIFLSANTWFMAETKIRKDKAQEFFDKYGAMLELKKIEGMQTDQEKILRKKGKVIPMLYFNFSADSLMIYQLQEKQNYKFDWRLLPKDNITPEVKIWKLVSNLFKPIQTITINGKENGTNC